MMNAMNYKVVSKCSRRIGQPMVFSMEHESVKNILSKGPCEDTKEEDA